MVKGSLPPGYRFHPTDVELVWYYLKRKVLGKPFRFETISVVDLYKFSPWDLPGKATLRSGDLEWYFFCPRDKKYSHGSRINRATETGFWKATGKDRHIVYNSQTVGMKKTLIFHLGKPPSGERTDWVMYEFRLQINDLAQDTYVLCKIFQKSGAGPKNGEQYGAPVIEEDWDDNEDTEQGGVFPFFNCQQEYRVIAPAPLQTIPSQIGEVSSHNVQLGGFSSELPHHNFGVGVPSNNFEVGGPSSVPNFYESGTPSFSTSMLSEVELPSRQVQSEPGEFSYASETPGSGILLTQLEEILNTSPPNLHIVNDELFHFPIQNEDASQVPAFNLDSIYDDLGDLPVIPYPGGPTDLDFGNTMSCDFDLDPALLAEFAEEHYVSLSDFSLANDPHWAASPTDPIARANADTDTDTNALVEAYLNSEEMDNENSPQPRGPDDSGNDQKL